MKTRDRILETARLLFNEEGLAQVSTNRVAAELDISPGNLHYHFKRKEDLVAWLLRRFAETLRPFGDAHRSVEALDDLWVSMHLALEAVDHYRFLLRDVDYLLREFPALLRPMRELTAQRVTTMRSVLSKLLDTGVIAATDEQLDTLALHTILASTAWHSFENLLPPPQPPAPSGIHAAAYHLLVLLSPYVDEESRHYLTYLRSRYAK
ncbi:MAG: TetR/AcrR family transcriptional regulator [Burkholderiales bacterium]|nr:TetR/AcrR family transcriptional regulator [Burkholderiales bacterium]